MKSTPAPRGDINAANEDVCNATNHPTGACAVQLVYDSPLKGMWKKKAAYHATPPTGRHINTFLLAAATAVGPPDDDNDNNGVACTTATIHYLHG